MKTRNTFMDELLNKYGMLEAYRIAANYLEIQKNTTDAEEKQFCEELKKAMNKIDQF